MEIILITTMIVVSFTTFILFLIGWINIWNRNKPRYALWGIVSVIFVLLAIGIMILLELFKHRLGLGNLQKDIYDIVCFIIVITGSCLNGVSFFRHSLRKLEATNTKVAK